MIRIHRPVIVGHGTRNWFTNEAVTFHFKCYLACFINSNSKRPKWVKVKFKTGTRL